MDIHIMREHLCWTMHVEEPDHPNVNLQDYEISFPTGEEVGESVAETLWFWENRQRLQAQEREETAIAVEMMEVRDENPVG